MGKYGSGLSMEQMFTLEKKELKKEIASLPEEQQKNVLKIFDNAVYHALQGNISACAIENYGKAHGLDIPLMEYMQEKEKLSAQSKYEYEYEVDEDF